MLFFSFLLSLISAWTLIFKVIATESNVTVFADLQNDVTRSIKNIFLLDESINKLLELPYFRYIKMDLYKECPFWREDVVCTNKQCSVQILDEGVVQSEAPYMYHDQNLGDLADPTRVKPSFLKNCASGRDFCILEDEQAAGGVYVDLSKNPERFTGYSGVSANKVWQAIYGENCFNGNSLDNKPLCLEKQMFFKIISGLHTSISVHICAQYLDRATGEWKPNRTCYEQRIAPFPERIENALFVHSILVRAVAKLDYFFQHQLNICTGDSVSAEKGKHYLKKLVSLAEHTSQFNESMFFQGPQKILIEELRLKFRNISTIMDCVACQKCRLWGKTQITGIGAALKILFKTDPDVLLGRQSSLYPILTRFEVIALINTLHRFTDSLKTIHRFQATSFSSFFTCSYFSHWGPKEYTVLGGLLLLLTMTYIARRKSKSLATKTSKNKKSE